MAERRIVRAAHEKAGTKESYAVYQVTAGLPTGTFLMFIPYGDLSELDEVAAIHGSQYDEALGDDGRRRSRELTAASVKSATVVLFSVDQDLTYTPPGNR